MNNENENKKKNNFIKKIKDDVKKNHQHRAWVVLAGYFIFFLLIIISLRSNNSNYSVTDNSSTSKYFSIEKIKNNNYHFKYSVNLDNQNIIYEGDKLNSKSSFTKTTLDISELYYETDNIYLKFQDSEWVSSDNPFISKILLR